jgi:hypothetical protein
MLPILANYYTALIFLVTFLIKQKSNKLLMGGKVVALSKPTNYLQNPMPLN